MLRFLYPALVFLLAGHVALSPPVLAETVIKTEVAPISSDKTFGTPMFMPDRGDSTGEYGNPIGGTISDIGGLITELGGTVTETGSVVIVFESDVLFDFDKAEIKQDMSERLSLLARLVVLKKPSKVLIYGHTDSKGAEAYNLSLSLQRAESVQRWLVIQGGVSPRLLIPKGYGELKPIAPNTFEDGRDNPSGRAKNRRVEIVIEP